MIIIGEKLNSAIPRVRQLINDKNTEAIQDLAVRQTTAGANYLDINTSQGEELANMEWMVETIQDVTDIPLCIDSTSGEVIKKGLEAVKGDKSKDNNQPISGTKSTRKRKTQILTKVMIDCIA